ARSSTVGTPGALAERDAFMRLYAQRLRALQNVEARLCFGRLDLDGGERRYIGRVGMSDEARRELLVDWRAPAAGPFYRATAGRALARRPWHCTAPRSCCTRTASASSVPVSCSSARTASSCATSIRCCPPSARPTPSSCRRPVSSSPVLPRLRSTRLLSRR